MSRRSRVAFALALMLAAGQTCLGGGEPPFVPGQALVRLIPSADIAAFNARYGTSSIDGVPARNIHLVALPTGANEQNFRDNLAADAEVVSAELNYIADEQPPGGSTQSLFFRTSRAAFIAEPAFSIVQAADSGDQARGTNTVVAVLDTGIDASHPELAGRIAPGGIDLVSGASAPADVAQNIDSDGDGRLDEFVGHGTLVSGLVARAAPDCRIMPVRVMDSDGVATTFRVTRGIYHALDHGAHVINLSLGTFADPLLLRDALLEAQAAGVVVVAAAGNDNAEVRRYPSAFQGTGVICVSATDGATLRAGFANYGEWITLCAPGVDVVSTTPGNEYGRASGTSFATPLVAAAAAVIRSGCAVAGPAEVRAALLQGATSLDPTNPGFETKLGAGLLNVAASVSIADALGSITILPDFNNDRTVSTPDLVFFLGRFGKTVAPGSPEDRADLNRDGEVTTPDLVMFLGRFGQACP